MVVQGTSLRVLVVDDHEPTARLIATVMEAAGKSISTQIVRDGRECLAVLKGEIPDSRTPDLVLLDLDLPVVDGQSVLEQRRGEGSLQRIPTIVLSGSDDQDTIRTCYELGANAFIAKPGNLDEYDEVAASITDFWVSTASLP